MKIHKYISFPIMLLTMLTACESSHVDDNLLDSTVYFSRSGVVHSVLFYDAEETHDYTFYAVNAGFYEGATTASIVKDATIIDKYNNENGTTLKELPADCYTLVNSESQITKDERSCSFDIRFDCEKLSDLSQVSDYSDLEDYVVPLLLKTDGSIAANDELNTMFIHPDMRQVSVSVESIRNDTIIPKSRLDGTIKYEFSVKTAIENKWEVEFDVLSGDDAIQYINSNLIKRGGLSAYSSLVSPPAEAYTVEFDNTINPGTSAMKVTITVDGTKLPEGYSSIALYLNSATVAGVDAPIEGAQHMIINMRNVDVISTEGLVEVDKNTDEGIYLGKYLENFGYTILPRTDWIFTPDSYHGSTQGRAIDEDTGSQWENRYRDDSGGGPKSYLPFNAILDLGSVQTINAIELWRRRHATYVKDLREYELYVSDDKVNWTYVTTIDYGIEAKQRAMCDIIPKVSAQYVNFYITKSNRSANVSIAELFLWNK